MKNSQQQGTDTMNYIFSYNTLLFNRRTEYLGNCDIKKDNKYLIHKWTQTNDGFFI